MPTRYYISLPDASRARGSEPTLAFQAQGGEALAAELQAALTGDGLFQRWRAMQPDPDDVDPGLGVSDPAATVSGAQDDMRTELVVVTRLPGDVLKHRLRLLAGHHWELRDVTAA